MSRKIRQDNPGNAVLFPVAFILAAVPLMVYLKEITLSAIETESWGGDKTYSDFFNYFKSQWLIIITVLAILFFLGNQITKGFKIDKKFIYIPTGIYALLIILSTIFSKYKEVALDGFIARYEGMYILLCYIALMFIVINLVKSEKQMQFLLKALLISALIIGLIGAFQLIGLDLFRTNFGKRLILPQEYHDSLDAVDFRFEKSYIYSTLANPNYVGSYMVMLIPIAFTAFIFVKKIWVKAGFASLTLILIANLLGSRSRAGLIGAGVAVIFGLILLRKFILKRKLLFFGAVGVAIALFIGINAALNGMLINRIVSELNIMFSGEVQFFDLKDITFSDNKVSIVSGTETLNITKNENGLKFLNTQGADLNIDIKDIGNAKTITFKDEDYMGYFLVIQGRKITVYQKLVELEFSILDDGFSLIGIGNKEVKQIEKPESIGFVGKERLGSARGYIWSRSLPLLKKTLFLGFGPDTFTINFPQEDYIGKIRAYGTPKMIVDKPHNMYLQMAMNTGVLSLIAFLVVCGAYIIECFKLYLKKLDDSFICLAGTGIFLGICGYLVAAVFNDSMVAIAPVFWVLLGLGFVCNKWVTAQQLKVGTEK